MHGSVTGERDVTAATMTIGALWKMVLQSMFHPKIPSLLSLSLFCPSILEFPAALGNSAHLTSVKLSLPLLILPF